MSKIPSDYDHRVYAGWLGKCIGVRFGAPVEGWSYQQIRDTLGELTDYLPLPVGKLFKPDDDTALPMLLIQGLADYGGAISAENLGETWLNYLSDQQGTLWWGGYGVSTEHTAYRNLANGIPAPLSGSIAMNGSDMAEQIGGQIFSDIWGLVAPNNPELAADYAARAASVSHDGNGVYGGQFIAGLVSAAFSESDPGKLIEIGLGLIPAESAFAQVVNAVVDFHQQQPDDWHAAYQFIFANYGYDRYPGEVHIIPNAAIVAMALLYSKGDFSRAIQIANMGGWDTDCNVGNVGAIMGVAVGLTGIAYKQWREPMDDILVATGVIGSRNLWTIPACADLFCRLGREIAGEAVTAPPRYHFRYPDSTQGTQSLGADKGRIMAMNEDAGRLRITLRKLKKKGEVRCFFKTYIRPDELSANYYGASFSPQIYAGQTVRARLFLPSDGSADLRAGLFVRDANSGQVTQATAQPLTPGAWHDLTFEIPPLHNALLAEVGIVVRNLATPWTGNIFLESLDWAGAAVFSNDFALERTEYGACSQWTQLRGYWRLADGAYHGSGAEISESYTGGIEWRDYAVTVKFRPKLGSHHLVLARVQGARRSYAAGLGIDGQLVLYKNAGGYQLVASTLFAWQHDHAYTITLTVQGNKLTVAIDDTQIVWVDEDAPYLNGQIGFANFSGCHTAYEKITLFS